MFSTRSATVSFLFLLARVSADVAPLTPASANVGAECSITWTGDASGTGVWKGMAIQLMSGDNFAMVPVTTVTTDQDGSVDGSYTYTCPDVTPNSAIYFYQFTSATATNTTWTTRFPIAAADGTTTTPTNDTQPGGAAIPWGTGALVDQSAVVAPPSFASTSGSASASGALTSTGGSTATSSGSGVVVSSTGAPGASSSSSSDVDTVTAATSTTRIRTTSASATDSDSASGSATGTGSAAGSSSTGNSAVGLKSSGLVAVLAAAVALVL